MSATPEGPILSPHHDAIERAKALAFEAELAGGQRCIDGEYVFFMKYPIPLVPGHIYSEKGMDEFKISRSCEYHFDSYFAEEDDPSREVIGGKPIFT